MPNITHQFVSTLPDGADPTLVRASNWNQPHTIDVTGVLVGTSSPNILGVTAGARFRYLRSNITNTAYEFAEPSFPVNCTDFQFVRTFSQTISTRGIYNFDFATLPPGVTSTIYASSHVITNVTNNGAGLIRVTFSAPHTMETGSCLVVENVPGVTNANGAWIVNRVDFNSVDLQSSTFAGSYVAGGTAQERHHFVYLSGGAGVNEACPIISISGTTVSILVTAAKSGPYTITSATGGLQEATYAANKNIAIPHGFQEVYRSYTIDGNFFPNINIQGVNALGSVLYRGAVFTVGSVIRVVNGAGPNLQRFAIYNTAPVQITSGSAISYVKGGSYFTTITDVRVINERFGLSAYGTTGIYATGLDIRQFPNYASTANSIAGILIGSNPWTSNFGVILDGCLAISDNPQTASNPTLVGLAIEQGDGIQVNNGTFTGAQGIKIQRVNDSDTVNYVFFNNCIIDNCYTHSLFINSGTTGIGFFQNIRFNGCVFQYTDAAGQLVFIGGDKIRAFGVQFSGCAFSYSHGVLVYIGGASNISFDDCGFTSAKRSAASGWYLLIEGPTPCSNIIVSDCWFDESVGFPDNSEGILVNGDASKLTFTGNRVNKSVANGLAIASTRTVSNSVIANNIFANAAGVGLLCDGTLNGVALNGNTFINNVGGSMSLANVTALGLGPNQFQETTGPTIASAGTIALPANNFCNIVTLSGTTTISTISGFWPFRQVNFVTTGNLSFNTAGNIANSIGHTVAGQLVTAVYNPSTSKWHLI